MKELTLYRLCLSKVVGLLKSSKKGAFVNQDIGSNPFCVVPSPIIDDLITTSVLPLTGRHLLSVKHLYPLLTSGRIEHFKLDNIFITSKDFVCIFRCLSVACLRSITLRAIRFSDDDDDASLSDDDDTIVTTVDAAVELVLGISRQLEVIESCIEFDLKCIRNCEKLRVLKINFVPKSPLCSFLEASDGTFVTHNNLRVFEVCESSMYTPPPAEIANVMKYCPALVQMNTDITLSLELLHEAELLNGTLSTQYKLRKCCLGYMFSPPKSTMLTGVRIATMTCPLIEDIGIVLNNSEVVYALSDFPKLTSLNIHWERVARGDFQLGFPMLLDKVGANLKNLEIDNFYNVDFAAIATKCPIIEELSVEFHSEFQGYDVPSECFRCLKILFLKNIKTEYGSSEKTLFLLLSNATNLQRLHLHRAACLNDSVLVKIFQKNSLCHVKNAVIIGSSLSGEGVRNLVEHMKMLEYLHFSSSQVKFVEFAFIVHSINPNIVFSD